MDDNDTEDSAANLKNVKPARRWNMDVRDAIRLMNPEALAQALEADGPDALLARGKTPLTLAAEFPDDDIDLASVILDAGARVDLADALGQTPLLASLGHRNQRMARALLRRGARTGLQDGEGRTALMFSCGAALTDMARELIAKRADPNIRSFNNQTPLMACAMLRVGHERTRLLMGDLLQAGSDIDAVDDEGKSALVHATESGHMLAAILLFDAGASLSPPGSRVDAIQVARGRGHHVIADALSDKAASHERALIERSSGAATTPAPPSKRL